MTRLAPAALGLLGFGVLLFACGPDAAPAARASSAASSPHERERMLLVVSIDGLRHDYLDDPQHPLPTLGRLRREGASARTVHGVWPSVTYPAHTTLVTGVAPARHGIVNNVVFDPFERNDGGWYWYAADLRVPTLWDVAADAGIDVANATWPVTVGARIRYNLPQFWRAKNEEDEKLLAQVSTPGLWAEVARAAPPPGEHRPDKARADAAAYLIRTRRPGLALLYLADLDTVQHEHGPRSPEAWAAVAQADALASEVLAAAAAVTRRLTVAIVSDHGFASVDTDVRPNVALRREGLLEAFTRSKDGRTEDVLRAYDAVTWKAGGSAAIVGRRGREEPTASRVKALFTRLAADPQNRIAAVLDGEKVEREGGFPGAIVVLQAGPAATFSERFDEPLTAPSHYKGMHGFSPDMAEMSPSFILWGDRVRPGDLGDVRMLDIGPTLAAVLGLSLPAAEGRPLAAALGGPGE